MRGKLLIYSLGLGAVLAFTASPFVTAWSIREAIRSGDAPYLESKIEWPAVKASLKASMSTYALGPDPATPATAEAAPSAKPGLWQRLKAAYGRRVVASMVETMVTPHGLPKLFAYRKSFNENVRGLPDEAKTLPLSERIRRSWERVVRAEFLSPSRFAMEMRDKSDPQRSYAGILEFKGFEWKLVHLEIKSERSEPRPTAAARAWSAMKQAALP